MTDEPDELDPRDEQRLLSEDVDPDTSTIEDLALILCEEHDDRNPGSYLGAVSRLLKSKLEEAP